MGTIRFVLRTDKPLKNATCPVDLIYQVHGQRKGYRTDIKLQPHSWDPLRQEPLYLNRKMASIAAPQLSYEIFPTSADIEEHKDVLKELMSTIGTIEKRYSLDKIPYSSEMVVARLKEIKGKQTKKEESSNIIFDFIDNYIAENRATRKSGSLSVYKSLKNHLQGYCKKTGKKVTFGNIDYNFFLAFQTYLLEDKVDENGKVIPGLNNTTTAKQLSTIKTFLSYAKKNGVVVSDKYKDFKIKRENLEVIALTWEEFEILYNMDLTNDKRLAQVRDVFCFACTTGLRYSDLAQLKREHIKNNEIRLTVTKTSTPLTIPLNAYSKAILSKYYGHLKPLPVISNQKMNAYLKGWDDVDAAGNIVHHNGLCEIANIDEPVEIVRFKGAKREVNTYPKYELVGVHTGRKTFATLSLEKGMSAEEVMAIGGWKDYKSFKRYVKITEKRNKVVMMKAWGEPRELKAV